MRPLEAPATSSEQTARFGGANGTPRSGVFPAWTCVWVEGEPADSFISMDSVPQELLNWLLGNLLGTSARPPGSSGSVIGEGGEAEGRAGAAASEVPQPGEQAGQPRDDPLRGPPGGMDTRGR